MAAAEKLLEKVPYFEGGFRRRLAAGGLIVLPTTVGLAIQRHAELKVLGLSGAEVVTSPSVLVTLVLMIYVCGTVSEVFGEIFVARIAGNVAWAASYPFRRVPLEQRLANKLLSYVKIGLLFNFVVPWLIYLEFIKGVFGVSSYSWKDLPSRLSEPASATFHLMPTIVRTAVAAPFGLHGEIAWRYLSASGDADQRSWIRSLESRNKEVLVTLTALIVSLSFLASLFWPRNSPETADSVGQYLGIYAVFQVAAFFLLALFAAYFLTVQKSIISAIEVVALHLPSATEGKSDA